LNKPLCVFGYGSLMFAPECPTALIDVRVATLPGHRRAFNKFSTVRGCPREHVRWPSAQPPSGFLRDGRHFSLALGTEAGDGIVGRVLVYAAEHAADALLALDRREGFDANSPLHFNGYDRKTVDVHTPTGSMQALAYLGNPASELYRPLSLNDQAQALLAATPRPGTQPKEGGVEYLLETRRILAKGGIEDEHVERLMDTILATPGPWQSWLEKQV